MRRFEKPSNSESVSQRRRALLEMLAHLKMAKLAIFSTFWESHEKHVCFPWYYASSHVMMIHLKTHSGEKGCGCAPTCVIALYVQPIFARAVFIE